MLLLDLAATLHHHAETDTFCITSNSAHDIDIRAINHIISAFRLQQAATADMAAVVSNGGSSESATRMASVSKSFISIEERCFTAALVCLEGHYTDSPPMGPKTHAKVIGMVSKSLEKTHASKDVRSVCLLPPATNDMS